MEREFSNFGFSAKEIDFHPSVLEYRPLFVSHIHKKKPRKPKLISIFVTVHFTEKLNLFLLHRLNWKARGNSNNFFWELLSVTTGALVLSYKEGYLYLPVKCVGKSFTKWLNEEKSFLLKGNSISKLFIFKELFNLIYSYSLIFIQFLKWRYS